MGLIQGLALAGVAGRIEALLQGCAPALTGCCSILWSGGLERGPARAAGARASSGAACMLPGGWSNLRRVLPQQQPHDGLGLLPAGWAVSGG